MAKLSKKSTTAVEDNVVEFVQGKESTAMTPEEKRSHSE